MSRLRSSLIAMSLDALQRSSSGGNRSMPRAHPHLRDGRHPPGAAFEPPTSGVGSGPDPADLSGSDRSVLAAELAHDMPHNQYRHNFDRDSRDHDQ